MMRAGEAPSETMRSTVAGTTPAALPGRPACAVATIPPVRRGPAALRPGLAGVDDLGPVHLRQIQHAVRLEAEPARGEFAVAAHRRRVVADVVAEVERAVRGRADPAVPGP